MEQDSNAEVKQKTDFIPNPLPGPKPHVKKQMQYDYEVPPDKMHFDKEMPDRMFYDYD